MGFIKTQASAACTVDVKPNTPMSTAKPTISTAMLPANPVFMEASASTGPFHPMDKRCICATVRMPWTTTESSILGFIVNYLYLRVVGLRAATPTEATFVSTGGSANHKSKLFA